MPMLIKNISKKRMSFPRGRCRLQSKENDTRNAIDQRHQQEDDMPNSIGF